MMREVDFGLIHAELDSGIGKNKPKLAISKSQVVNASSADDGMLQIKIADEITNATYAIQSKDLIINFADDHEILVLKYLSQARVPSLVSDTGRFISRETIFTLTRFEYNAAVGASVAGSVVSIGGKAYVKRITGVKGELAERDEIYQGDYIATPRGSEIHIRMNDGSEYRIGQEARVTIDKFAFSQKPDLHRSVVSVLQGVVSYVSGDIAKHPAGEAIINTPVAVLSLKGEISGGWQVDEDGGHKFFAECPGESCNGRVEIKTLDGDRSLYQPNILISVENMLRNPVQLTNLENPKAMSMGEMIGADVAEEAANEVAASEDVEVQADPSELLTPEVEPSVIIEEQVSVEVASSEEVEQEEAAVEQIPVVDFFSAAPDAIEEKVEAEVASDQPEENIITAQETVCDDAQPESELIAIQNEEVAISEPESLVLQDAAAPIQEDVVLSASDEATVELEQKVDIEVEQPAPEINNVIALSSNGEKLVNGRVVQADSPYINGHGVANGSYFHPEKFVEFKGIDYEKLRFEKSGDGDDLVIKVINGSQDTGHMIVLKGFFGNGESHTSFEISGAGIIQHKVN